MLETKCADLPIRDMRFTPTFNAHPQRLTQTHIAQFNTQGYICGLPVFDTPAAQANRIYFDDLLHRVAQAGLDPAYGIADFHVHCRTLYDIGTHPTILAYVADLIGPDVVLWHTHVFAKPAGESKRVPWHQDAAYWPLTPTKTITVWLAIDDSDRGNGALQIIPGTHHGLLDFDVIDRAQAGAVLSKQIRTIEQYGTPIPLELKAGHVSIHPDMMAHGSEPNQSQRRRCGLTLRYCPVTVRAYYDAQREAQGNVRPHSDYHQKSVVVLGRDPSGYWANLPRPAGEFVPEVLR